MWVAIFQAWLISRDKEKSLKIGVMSETNGLHCNVGLESCPDAGFCGAGFIWAANRVSG